MVRPDRLSPLALTKPDTRAELEARFFKALADRTRVRILRLLSERERTVSELVEVVGSSQGRISSHLMCLRWCGFVETRREGKYVHYRLADGAVRELLRLTDGMIARSAQNILACTVVGGEHDGGRGEHGEPARGGARDAAI